MKYIYNCHTHIFNIDNAPEKFLEGFIPKAAAKIAWALLPIPIIKKLVQRILKSGKYPNISKYASFIDIGTRKSQDAVFNDLKRYYSKDDRFVVLTLDLDHMGAGRPVENYDHQAYEIKRVKKNNPNTCIPFYCVDPRAGSNDENKEKARIHISEKGFAGIKIYPALGFYPFDQDLEATFKWAEANCVPIMTHCTRVGSYYLGKITEKMTHPDNFTSPKKWPAKFGTIRFPIRNQELINKEFCDYFSYPYMYACVLEKFPKLKICFAHAGDDTEIIKDREGYPTSWFRHIKWLIKEHENVYTDISYTLSNTDIFPQLYDLLKDKKTGDRVLFGTDYFMTQMSKSEKKLIHEFREYLYSKPNGDLYWKKISVENPERYLMSKYYLTDLLENDPDDSDCQKED